MSHWTSRWLSLGGYKTLILNVLQSIPVHWMTLFRVPVSILSSLRKFFFRFLWQGLGDFGKFHLADWEFLPLPKSWGGWDFKHLGLFNLALCAKSLVVVACRYVSFL